MLISASNLLDFSSFFLLNKSCGNTSRKIKTYLMPEWIQEGTEYQFQFITSDLSESFKSLRGKSHRRAKKGFLFIITGLQGSSIYGLHSRYSEGRGMGRFFTPIQLRPVNGLI